MQKQKQKKCKPTEFAQEHSHIFQDASLDGEHKLEYKEAHNAYLQRFEGLLVGMSWIHSHFLSNNHNPLDYITTQGGNIEEFFDECRVSQENEDENGWFVDALLALTEYDRFFALMINECKLNQ